MQTTHRLTLLGAIHLNLCTPHHRWMELIGNTLWPQWPHTDNKIITPTLGQSARNHIDTLSTKQSSVVDVTILELSLSENDAICNPRLPMLFCQGCICRGVHLLVNDIFAPAKSIQPASTIAKYPHDYPFHTLRNPCR
jgi:hypothetical protein